ncbi:MAG: butyrate kinase [Candidatus Firestonebacteria bacterium]
MKKQINILVINPGSTSTKVAIFKNDKLYKNIGISHSNTFLKKFPTIYSQWRYRLNLIIQWLKNINFKLNDINVIAGRGGLLKPLKGGVYKINEKMLEDLKKAKYGSHASNLGAILSYKISEKLKIPSFIVDPVTVDELIPEARITGVSRIKRKSIFHALNQKAVAKRFGKDNLIVAHLGGGISIGVHKRGKVIDVNNALEEGPFSPERSGSLPSKQLVDMCFSGQYSKKQILSMLVGEGGLVSNLGTNDGKKIEKMIKTGNNKAKLIFKAMAYNIAKYIGSMATVLNGKVSAIILAGNLARSKMLIKLIKPKIKYIAPVYVYLGEKEMESLAAGALMALKGKTKILNYG